MPDQPWLPGSMTGRDFLLAVGKLYEIDEERLIDHAHQLLELFDLAEKGDSPIRNCSAGQTKKIAAFAQL